MKKDAENPYAQLYRTIADEALIGFICFKIDGMQVVYVNRLGMELLGFPQSELPNFTLESLFTDKDQRGSRAFNETWINSDGLYQDVLIRKFSGDVFTANVGVKRVNLQGQQHLLLMIQDITLQKKLQREVIEKQQAIGLAYKELLDQNKKLKELDLAKTRFTALTTHELRTPVSAMVGAAEILKLKLYDNEQQLEEFVDIIYDQGKQLAELVNDILDFSKIQAGRMDFYIQEADIIPTIINVAESLLSFAATNSVKLNFPKTETEALCYFDEVRIKQVLTNIISNAIKYNRVQGSVDVVVEKVGAMVRVSVKDSGVGIAPEDLSKVFNEFETLGKVSLHHKGTGLGMPISQRLMISMGGRVNVESQVGVGSTFWIEIPCDKVLTEDVYRARPDHAGDLAA